MPLQQPRSTILERENGILYGLHLKVEKSAHLSSLVRNALLSADRYEHSSAKDIIKSSKLYEIIKRMPKGGLLHAHTDASEFVICFDFI